MKYLKKYKLFETPDEIYALDPVYDYYKSIAKWNDPDAFAFGILDGKMFLGNPAETHVEYTLRLKLRKEVNTDGNSRLNHVYPGRIWIKKKLISFWKYPKSRKEMNKIIHMIEVAFKTQFGVIVDIWNDDEYKIEVNESPEKSVTDSGDNDFYGAWNTYKEDERKLISLKDFRTSYDVSNDLMSKAHTEGDSKFRNILRKAELSKLTPEERTEIEKDSNVKGTVPYLKWKYAHKYEKLNYISNTDNYKLFESADRVIIFNKDTKSFDMLTSNFDSDARPFAYYDNELHLGLYKEIHNFLMSRVFNGEHPDVKLEGRIWLDKKIISFWEYPKDNAQLEQVVVDIEDVLKEEGNEMIIWNDPDFKIEVKITDEKKNQMGLNDYLKNMDLYELIPLKEYKIKYRANNIKRIAHTEGDSQLRYLLRKAELAKLTPEERAERIKRFKSKGSEEYLKWKYAHKYEKRNEN